MTKAIPSVHKYMTSTPHSIGVDQTLAKAHEMMRKHRVRHLPVLKGGALVGILTERDLHLVETLKDVDPQKVLVEEAMNSTVYSVSPEALLDEVVGTMASEKYGCAVILDRGHVVGIFTTVDVCRAFGELLNTRLTR